MRGKLVYNDSPRVAGGDHPRGCGENTDNRNEVCNTEGSPPRMRGKLIVSCISAARRRITPADAGKTLSAPDVSIVSRITPADAGKTGFCPLPVFLVVGSPPRMRGKLKCLLSGVYLSRITPADAGKTSVAIGTGVCNRDHPRGCGENC